MDGATFAQLSRRVGEAPTRRAALKVLAAALAAPLLGGLGQEQAAAVPIVNCKAPGKRCDSDHEVLQRQLSQRRLHLRQEGAPVLGAAGRLALLQSTVRQW